MSKFNEKLRELRMEKDITQKQMANDLNISVPTLSHWECGYQEPSIKDLTSIANYFDIPIDELLDRQEITPEEKAAGASATRKVNITPIEDDMLYVFRRIGKKHGEEGQRALITVAEKML